MSRFVIVFAGGGTGGHVFPMLAVADAVKRLAPRAHPVFIGTDRGLETRFVPECGYELELLRIEPMRGGGLRQAVRGAVRAVQSLPGALEVVRRHAPSAVFSIGGYAAGPTTLAARALGIPVALMEPNSEIGFANRLVAPLIQRAYTAFPETAKHFSANSVLETGVPVRSGFEPAALERSDVFKVLVLGGSQGAVSLNKSVPRALAQVGGPLRVVHQVGKARRSDVEELYASLGAASWATVVPFIDDVPAALAEADLVIGRSGASAVAEICAVGRGALYIPYPYAGDHQRSNAESVVRAGAAVRVLAAEAVVERIAHEVERLRRDPELLERMAARARSLGRPRAAETIARDLLELAGHPVRSSAASAFEPPASGSGPASFTIREAT